MLVAVSHDPSMIDVKHPLNAWRLSGVLPAGVLSAILSLLTQRFHLRSQADKSSPLENKAVDRSSKLLVGASALGTAALTILSFS